MEIFEQLPISQIDEEKRLKLKSANAPPLFDNTPGRPGKTF